jgi:hypothetical protein
MNNIYREEFYKIIEQNSFDNLPNQELINSDERVALAVWKNYQTDSFYRYDEYDEDKKYLLDWTKILNKYEEDTSFWEKANLTNELLNINFCKLFPMISDYFLNNKEFIANILDKKEIGEFIKKEFFLILQNLSEDKVNVKKDFLLNSTSYVTKEDIQDLQEDKDFIFKLIQKNQANYSILSDRNKFDEKIIDLVKNNKQTFHYLDKKLQLENLDSYIKINPYMPLDEIKKLDEDVIPELIKKLNRFDFMVSYYNKSNKKYKDLLLANLDGDKDTYKLKEIMSRVNEDGVNYLFKNNIEKIKPALETWIKNLSVNKLMNSDTKIISLISLDSELTKKLNDSYEYNLSLVKTKNGNISLDFLKEYAKSLLNRSDISKEQMNSRLIEAKSLLPISVIKDLRISKKDNLLTYLNYTMLQEKFEIKDKLNDIKDKKIKI